jgi:subtilisin-like proprotein convertase family protein
VGPDDFTYGLKDAQGNVIGNAATVAITMNSLDVPIEYVGTDMPKRLSDPGTTNATLTVRDGVNIKDIDVQLDIEHPRDRDLTAYLVAPDGTRVLLFDRVGSNTSANFTDTYFDDAATQGIASGTAPYTGHFRPQGSLAALNGKSTAGTWTLEITDGQYKQTGTLKHWSLVVTAADPLAMPPAAPANLAATVSGSTVTLTWSDLSDNETGFEIQRAKKPKSGTPAFSTVAITGADVTTWQDQPGAATWLYRVRAVNSYGYSAYTPNVQITVAAKTSIATSSGELLAWAGAAVLPTRANSPAAKTSLAGRATDAALAALLTPAKPGNVAKAPSTGVIAPSPKATAPRAAALPAWATHPADPSLAELSRCNLKVEALMQRLSLTA